MAHRGIVEITLYQSGFIQCTDQNGRQAPPLQGLYNEMVAKVREHFGPDEVIWKYNEGGIERQISFDEWVAIGDNQSNVSIPQRQFDATKHGVPVVEPM
jgi:hypothetical protein